MMLDRSRLMLSFKKPFKGGDIAAILERAGLDLEDSRVRESADRRQLPQVINHTDQRLWVRSPAGQPIDQRRFEEIAERLRDELDLIEPVYRLAGSESRSGLLCPISNVLVLKPERSGNDIEKLLNGMAEKWELSERPRMSKYLGAYRFYVLNDPDRNNSYRLRDLLLENETELVSDVVLQNMPLLSPLAATPNDPQFGSQWNMAQIHAPEGWQLFPGAGFPSSLSVLVAIFDSGCQLDHPDLLSNKFSDGTTFDNLGAISGIGEPRSYPANPGLIGHGTWVAGVTSAAYNNSVDVAGLAGGFRFFPIAFNLASDVEVAAGIHYAVAQAAADPRKLIINMSFGNGYDRSHIPLDPGMGTDPTGNTWHTGFIDAAIAFASSQPQPASVVMCAATHNHNTLGGITYPATNSHVMACGASDTMDNRWILDPTPQPPVFPAGIGSNYGAQMSVVAPGSPLPTTDIASGTFAGFGYTSGATPHVSGLAALLFGKYPALTSVAVRNIIERTAEKTGILAYSDSTSYPNGVWNNELGYGRINVKQALDFADVYIKDYAGDNGTEPSSPPGGDFWDFSDIVIRTFDDNVFNPGDPTQSNRVERHNQNFLYVRVTNSGPQQATNAIVNVRITPYVGAQFMYPTDWVASDATHVTPTPAPGSQATPGHPVNILSGNSVIAKFTISASQVEDLWGWENSHPWHPCLLASVKADNDYAFASFDVFATGSPIGGAVVVRRNNLAQRNLTVVNLVAPFLKIIHFPFVVGHRFNAERFMEIVVDAQGLPPGARLRLSLDEDGSAFPRVDFTAPAASHGHSTSSDIVFLERTTMETTLGCWRGILTLEKGSRFGCLPCRKLGKVTVEEGSLILDGDRRFVLIERGMAIVRIEKQPNQIYPVALEISLPAAVEKGRSLTIKVAQRNEKQQVVGGAGVVYRFG